MQRSPSPLSGSYGARPFSEHEADEATHGEAAAALLVGLVRDVAARFAVLVDEELRRVPRMSGSRRAAVNRHGGRLTGVRQESLLAVPRHVPTAFTGVAGAARSAFTAVVRVQINRGAVEHMIPERLSVDCDHRQVSRSPRLGSLSARAYTAGNHP